MTKYSLTTIAQYAIVHISEVNITRKATTMQATQIQSITNVIYNAYVEGLLQFDNMSICNIQVSLLIFSNFNQLTFQYNGKLVSVSIYDNDSETAQNASILNTVDYIVNVK